MIKDLSVAPHPQPTLSFTSMSQIPLIRQIMSDLLSGDDVADVVGLRAALDAISASSTIGLQAVAEHLLSIPEIFAYIVSGISSLLLVPLNLML